MTDWEGEFGGDALLQRQRDEQRQAERARLLTAPKESRRYEGLKPKPWQALMRGVRVEGETVAISAKGGNEGARALCAALIEEMNK